MNNNDIDISNELKAIADNFATENYSVVVQQALVLIEKKLREAIKRDWTHLESKVQVKLIEHLATKKKAIDELTMGEIVGLLRETKFLDAWKRKFDKDLRVFEMAELNKLVELRNEVAHGTRSVFTREEAVFVKNYREVVFQAFESDNPEYQTGINPKLLLKTLKKPVVILIGIVIITILSLWIASGYIGSSTILLLPGVSTGHPVPKIISPVTHEVVVNNQISYQIKTEPQADQFEVMELPNGLSFDSNTGIISGSLDAPGNVKLSLMAKKGSSTSEPFLLTLVVKSKEKSPNVVLRLHGSNTIGAKLAPALVEAFMTEKGYIDIKRVPVANLELLVEGKKPNSNELDAVEIKSHGSSTAFDETDKTKQVGLLGEYCDIGMSSSQVKPDTVKKFQSKNLGNPASKNQEHIIALDGLAIVVNFVNPIDKLSVDKIRKIFLGEITDWSAVGGKEGKINLYSRDDQSGTYDTFKHLVLSGKKLDCDIQYKLKCFEDSRELAANVASDPQGIGFIGLNYISTNKALKISMAGNGNALAPNRFTVKTEDYPLSRRLFLYQTNQPSPLAAEFIQFSLSNQGQRIVSDVGVVNVSIDEEKNDKSNEVSLFVDIDKEHLLKNRAIPDGYKQLIRNADRKDTQLNFRFDSGSFELDNRAHRDIGRIAEKLSKPEFEGARLVLIGFADPKGEEAKNLELSRKRAAKVATYLKSEGIVVGATAGFGEEPSLLLDPREDVPESLEKNRRVEVWLQRPKIQ